MKKDQIFWTIYRIVVWFTFLSEIPLMYFANRLNNLPHWIYVGFYGNNGLVTILISLFIAVIITKANLNVR